jgi:hypothetical protein
LTCSGNKRRQQFHANEKKKKKKKTTSHALRDGMSVNPAAEIFFQKRQSTCGYGEENGWNPQEALLTNIM